TAREVGRGQGVADVGAVVAGATGHGDAVHDAHRAEAVVAGAALLDGVAARTGVEVVGARPAADDVVAAVAEDVVIAVAADDDVVTPGPFDEGRPDLTGGVQPGVAGRAAVAQGADRLGGADLRGHPEPTDEQRRQ